MSVKEVFKRQPRPLRFALVAAGAIVLLIVGIRVYVETKRPQFKAPDAAKWQTGDIFFSSGNSWKSDVVRIAGGSSDTNTSHCGFVMREADVVYLVHMSTDKGEIAKEELTEYVGLNDVNTIVVSRLTFAIDTLRLRHSLERLIQRRKKFDNSFNHKEDGQYYCTEMVVKELSALGYHEFDPLLKQQFIYPQDLEKSSYLSPVRLGK